MTGLFLEAVNRSISAGYLVLLIVLVRLVGKKMPKWAAVALWALVALRLMLPEFPESSFSLVPSAQVISPEIMLSPEPTIHTGISSADRVLNPVITERFAPEVAASANPLQILLPVLAQVWLLGMAGMGAYTLISYLGLRRRVRTAVKLRDNLYQSELVASPFLLGMIRPRIYLPLSLSGEALDHVVAHEQAHLRRRDHWWKLLGFGLLTLTWFHPLMWWAYILLCRDIELACDEAVVKKLTPIQRVEYSQALLDQSIRRRHIAACPLAFGEVGVKERVKRVLDYRKPAFWLVAVSAALCCILGLTFLTNPSSAGLELLENLRQEDISTIHRVTVRGEDVATTFYKPEEQNLYRVLPLLTSPQATPIARPWGADGDTDVFVIFLKADVWKDGRKFIEVRMVDDQYLVVDGDWYRADPQWLAQFPQNVDCSRWLTTLRREFVEAVEFFPAPGSGLEQAEIGHLIKCLNQLHIPAIGYPETLPEVLAVYRITTVEGITREIRILEDGYLMVEQALYHVSSGWMEDLNVPQNRYHRPFEIPMALEVRLGTGQVLALVQDPDVLTEIMNLLNQGQEADWEPRNYGVNLNLFWSNGDMICLPVEVGGDYFYMDNGVHSYGTEGQDNREILWKLLGFGAPIDSLEDSDGPVELENSLVGTALVMPPDTIAVNAQDWNQGNRYASVYSLSRRDGRYRLRTVESGGVGIRDYRYLIPVEEEGIVYYVLTNDGPLIPDLKNVPLGSYVLAPS